MSKAYLTCVSHASNLNRSQNKSVSSVQKKQIIDSTLLDQTSESCIVNDESTLAVIQTRKTRNTHEQIGRVGMSSRVSSKISFNLPKGSFAHQKQKESNVESFTKGSFAQQPSNQRSIFSEVLLNNNSCANSKAFKTIDARAINRNTAGKLSFVATKSSTKQTKEGIANSNNMKLSCCTSNKVLDGFNLDETQCILQQQQSGISCAMSASLKQSKSQQNIVPPNIILSQNFNKTVQLKNDISNKMMSPHFNNQDHPTVHRNIDRQLQLQNFESMKVLNRFSNSNDQKYSLFNTVDTKELPDGSSNFMQTTYTMTEGNKRGIPNEISESSDKDESIESEGHARNYDSDSPRELKVADEGEEFVQNASSQHSKSNKQQNKGYFDQFQIQRQSQQLSNVMNKNGAKPSHTPMQSAENEQIIVKLNDNLIKQHLNQQNMNEGGMTQNGGHSPKQYIHSQISSNNTIKFEMGPSSSLKSSGDQNQSELSKISSIRNELKFPQIQALNSQVNRSKEQGPNFFNNDHNPDQNRQSLPQNPSKPILVIKQQQNEDYDCSGATLISNQKGIKKPVIQRISLQPSLDNSEFVRQEDGRVGKDSSNYSVLEEMCQEISDIKIKSEMNDHGTSQKNINGESMNGHSPMSITDKHIKQKVFEHRSKKNSSSRSRKRSRQKSIDTNHQQFLFPEYIDETDFLLNQQRGQGQGSSKRQSQEKIIVLKEALGNDDQILSKHMRSTEDRQLRKQSGHHHTLSETQTNHESKQQEDHKKANNLYAKHINNKSSFGGFDPGSFAKGNIHQQTTALLENSCVTFQYYNSQFASNSTAREGNQGQQPAQNYFYLTNESQDSKYNSKESGQMSAGAFPPDLKPKYQHKKVSDLIHIGGINEEDDQIDAPIQNAEYNFSLQDQIIQERAAIEEESQQSESLDHGYNLQNSKKNGKNSSQKQNRHLLSKAKVTVIDLGVDIDDCKFNNYESLKISSEKSKQFQISETKFQDSRNLHIIKSASNNEAGSNYPRSGMINFDPTMVAASSQREFIVDDSNNDQSYTILQAASISANNGKEKTENNHQTTNGGQESNLNSNHKLCFLNSVMSGQSQSQTPKGNSNNHIVSQADCRIDEISSEEKQKRNLEQKMIMFDNQIKQININQLKPLGQQLKTQEKNQNTQKVANMIDQNQNLRMPQQNKVPQGPEIQIVPINNTNDIEVGEMNIVQYPSEMNSHACPSVNMGDGSKSGSFTYQNALNLVDVSGNNNEGEINALFMKMSKLSALCMDNDIQIFQNQNQIGGNEEIMQFNQSESSNFVNNQAEHSHKTSHLSQVSESHLQSRIAKLSSQIAQMNIAKPNEESKVLSQGRDSNDLQEFKSAEIQAQIEVNQKQEKIIQRESAAYLKNLMKSEEKQPKGSSSKRGNNVHGPVIISERPKSSRITQTNDQNVMILPPKHQNSDFKEPNSYILVNQSGSSLNSKTRSKWQNQFRSRSKTKSMMSNRSRNNQEKNQCCLTERESNQSNGQNGINIKKELQKSRSFVQFSSNQNIPMLFSKNENILLNDQQSHQMQQFGELHHQQTILFNQQNYSGTCESLSFGQLQSSRNRNGISQTLSRQGGSNRASVVQKDNEQIKKQKSKSKLIPPTILTQTTQIQRQNDENQVFLPQKLKSQVKNKSRQVPMTQRQNMIYTESIDGEEKGLSTTYKSTRQGMLSARGQNSSSKAALSQSHQSNGKPNKQEPMRSSNSMRSKNNQNSSKNMRQQRANNSKQIPQVPNVISVNLTGVAKKIKEVKSQSKNQKIIADLKGQTTHEQSKELSQEISKQINELNNLYQQMVQPNK